MNKEEGAQILKDAKSKIQSSVYPIKQGEQSITQVDQLETPFYVYPNGGGEFILVIKTMNKMREVKIKSTGTEIYIVDKYLVEPIQGVLFDNIPELVESRFHFYDQCPPGFIYLKVFI